MHSIPFSLPGFEVTEVISTAEQLIICATSRSVEAACPACHEASRGRMKERNAASLQAWLDTCIGSQMVELEDFAHGLQNEFSALQAALTLPYSNGPVEGVITKVKCIRRSMYGRGSFPLLRQRVLQAA